MRDILAGPLTVSASATKILSDANLRRFLYARTETYRVTPRVHRLSFRRLLFCPSFYLLETPFLLKTMLDFRKYFIYLEDTMCRPDVLDARFQGQGHRGEDQRSRALNRIYLNYFDAVV